MTLPSKERQYECMRIIANCYHNNNFDNLYPLLADNVKYFTQRTYDDTVWKDWVIKIYKQREKDFDKVFCETQIVELIEKWQQARIMLMYDTWKLCVLMTKYKDWEQYNSIIVPKYEWDKISEIWVCDICFYNFHTWRPWNWEHVDWGKWIPNYKETDIMRDEEFCDFAINIVHDNFVKSEWYEILYTSNFLNSFPSFALKKDWKTILVIVRWCWAPNMPTIEKIEKDYFIQEAKKQWLEIYFAPVGFWATDPERFEQWLLLRWDSFYAKFTWIEPLE